VVTDREIRERSDGLLENVATEETAKEEIDSFIPKHIGSSLLMMLEARENDLSLSTIDPAMFQVLLVTGVNAASSLVVLVGKVVPSTCNDNRFHSFRRPRDCYRHIESVTLSCRGHSSDNRDRSYFEARTATKMTNVVYRYTKAF